MKFFYKLMSGLACLKWVYTKAMFTTCFGTEEATSAQPIPTGRSSALCKALHKADYAKSLIMESGFLEHAPGAVRQYPARIWSFA